MVERKLDHEMQIKMCELIARFMSVPEILRKFSTDYNIKIGPDTVKHYSHSKKWADTIQKFRDNYVGHIMDIPIAQKRVRLERFEQLYRMALAKGSISAAREILKCAKDELEGAKEGDINIQMNKIEMISDSEIRDRIKKIKQEMSSIPISAEVEAIIA